MMNIIDKNAMSRMGIAAERVRPDVLAQAPSPVGNIEANADAQNVQNNYTSPAVGACSENLRLGDSAHCSESSSVDFENRWRWPVSYRSIEVLAVIIDIVIILSAGVLAETAYRLTTTESPSNVMTYAATAAMVAALFTSLLKGRGLYKPAVLLSWTSQIRAVATAWIGIFMFLAGCVFALKIGSTFSRGTIIAFATIGLCGVVAHRTFWRTALENGLASGKWSGRAIVLISANPPAPDLRQDLLWHGFQVQRLFVLGADSSPAHWAGVMSQAISYTRRSNVDEIFIAAELKSWAKLQESVGRLRLLPLPVNLVAVGPTSELLMRPLSAIGNRTVIELQRAPLNSFELSVKRAIDIILAGAALIALMPLLTLVAIAIKLNSPGPVIFRQTRHGFNGKPFPIFKFRTMTVVENDELGQTSRAFRQSCDARRLMVAPNKHRRVTSVDQRAQGRDVDRRSAAARGGSRQLL